MSKDRSSTVGGTSHFTLTLVVVLLRHRGMRILHKGVDIHGGQPYVATGFKTAGRVSLFR